MTDVHPAGPARRALLTGATSLLGSRLCRRLVAEGWIVHAVVRPGSDLGRLGEARAHVATHAWDGTWRTMAGAVEAAAPTDVFHLAVAGGIDHAPPAVPDLIEANVLLGTLLLEFLPPGTRVVNAATYWQHAVDGHIEPVSLHAATKEAFAALLQWYQASRRVHSVTLVIYDVYGPDDSRSRLIPRLVKALATREALGVTPGHQRLDFVHVDDTVAALVHAADRLAGDTALLDGRRFAVRSGTLHSIRELVTLIERISGRNIPLHWGALPLHPRQLESPWEGPILPGWKARISLEQGLREVLALP